MRKKGFTIVEMLMVVAVLAVLMGLATIGATSAIRNARAKRAEAMQKLLQAGIATFYAQNDYWPGALRNYAENGTGNNSSTRLLSPTETDALFSTLVEDSLRKSTSPYVDVQGLFAAEKSTGRKTFGRDFREVLKTHRNSWKGSYRAFGYPDREKTYFRRFWVVYNAETDQTSVLNDAEKRSRFPKEYTNE